MICRVDRVARVAPAVEVGGQAALPGHADRALDRDPAHQPRVDEVLAAAAHLPDALVGPVPVVADPVDEPTQRRSRRRRRSARRTCCRGRPSRSARRRCRAAAGRRRRCRSAPAASRGSPRGGRAQLLGRSGRPSMPYMICSGPSPRPSLVAAAVCQPVHEGLGLLGEAEPQQGVEGEGGVADPGVAVVPVAPAADALGQAGGRGGDDRAGRP